MKTLLRERLRYLSNKGLVRLIIKGTYDISVDMDPGMRLVLEKIGMLGMKIVSGKGIR